MGVGALPLISRPAFYIRQSFLPFEARVNPETENMSNKALPIRKSI